jgi:hypothetical protein
MPSKEIIVPFIGGSYEYRSKGVSVQRTLNLYPENIENNEGKVNQTLVYTPGSVNVATIGTDTTAICRGFWYSSTGPTSRSLLYTAYGNKVYRVNPDLTIIELGDIASGTGPVQISDNGFVLVVADGVNLYQLDLLASDVTAPSTWAQVSLPFLAGTTTPLRPSQVQFLNQRFIINSQRGEFYFSELASTEFYASGDINQQNFYSAESNADIIKTIQVVGNRLWLFGERSYEVWSGTGTTNDDPFSFMQGSASGMGVQSERSVGTIYESVFFLGASDAGINTVFMSQGLNMPQRISTNALENTISTISDAQGAIGWCYYNEGHIFYVLTFPNADRTFVFDVSTNLWHERSTRDWTTTTDIAWEPLFAVTAYNEVYHGSVLNNRLLKLDSNKYTDADDKPIVRQRITPIYMSDFNPVKIREFFLDLEVGTTPLLAGLGRDPQVVLDVSRDGGYTWINYDWRSIGAQGDYTETVKWSNLGSGRAIAVRLTFSDPSPIVLYGARLVIQPSKRR